MVNRVNKIIKDYSKQLVTTAQSVNKINSKNKISIIIDQVYCTLKYGSSPNNYLNF
ncbi:hypothetical protein SAMN04488114_1356 [Carnobacterium iners]|nr:hypothetical protein SAMN04488114_1356 [Carnobacterium iners]